MPIARQTPPVKPSLAADPRIPRTLLLATDLQQSILAELDRSGPNSFAYSPYGLQSGRRGAGTHLGFNGQFKEGTTGWYHLGNGHRVYNPALMRFHSPDRLSPFGKGGINPYAYCSGSPVNRVDPTGESWFSVLGQAVGAGLNLIFAGAAVNRAASAIVSGATQTLRMRIGNTLSFWGGAASLPFRSTAVPGAITARIPEVVSIVSTSGVMAGQGLTGSGAAVQNSVIAGKWWGDAAKNGQSRPRVLWEALKEASGWNLLRRQPPGRVPIRTTETPLEEVVSHSPPVTEVQEIRRSLPPTRSRRKSASP
jgi:RHS repeat-associated protein